MSSFFIRLTKIVIYFLSRVVVDMKKNRELDVEDKYYFYENSVQDPEFDVELFSKIFKEHRERKALKFREDFCGTFYLSCEWVKSDPKRTAVGLDISEEPTDYGMKHHYSKLTPEQKKRIKILNQDVRNDYGNDFDIVGASNFSYFFFKDRNELRDYFKSVYNSLNSDGMLILDHFGGPDNARPNLEERDIDLPDGRTVLYQWDMDYFDPITNHSIFYIHYKMKGKKYPKVFTYTWRMWSLPELTEILKEAGFFRVLTYWENDDDEFVHLKEGDTDLDAWVVQIVALK